MSRLLSLVIVIFVILVSTCMGQSADSVLSAKAKSYYLVFYKPGRITRYPFYIGQTITFKLVNNKKYFSGKITAIAPSSFTFWDTEIPLSQVEKIQLENHTPMRKAIKAGSTLLRKGGSLFALVGAFNFLVLPDQRQDGVKTSGIGLSAYVLGRGGKILQRRSYKLNQNRLLKTRETY